MAYLEVDLKVNARSIVSPSLAGKWQRAVCCVPDHLLPTRLLLRRLLLTSRRHLCRGPLADTQVKSLVAEPYFPPSHSPTHPTPPFSLFPPDETPVIVVLYSSGHLAVRIGTR